MKLSPLDISKQDFAHSLRGYNPAEVRAFLEKVADELAELDSERAQLFQQSIKFETQLESYKQMEKALRDGLLAAQKALEEAQESTKRERELLLREAQAEAEQIIYEAKQKVQAARDELHHLTAQRDAYVKRLRFLLQSQQELVDMLENESPLPERRDDESHG
jgi:cell division initiation protein